MKQYLDAGKIVGIHGFRGTVKAESRCDSPRVLASLKKLYLDGDTDSPRLLHVAKSSVTSKHVLLTFAEINSEDEANALRGCLLYADRNDIPLRDGAAFLSDMIGLPVIDAENGKRYGKLKDVQDGVSSRLYEIDTPNGTVLMPEVDEFIDHISVGDGIYIRPIPGFFDENFEEIVE